MKELWFELTNSGSRRQFKRLAFFVAVTFLYFKVALPGFHWLFLNGQFEKIASLNLQAPYGLDGFYSTFATSILVMELAFRSNKKASLIWIAIAGYFLFKLPIITAVFSPLLSGYWSTGPLSNLGKLLFPTTLLSFGLTMMSWFFPIAIGITSKSIFEPSSLQSSIELTAIRLLKLIGLFFLPFVIIVCVVSATYFLVGIGAMLPYFVLVPWIYLLPSFTFVSFIALVTLRLNSDSGFTAWLILMITLVPLCHYYLNIEFPEQRMNALSLIVFALVIFCWRKWIGSVLSKEILYDEIHPRIR